MEYEIAVALLDAHAVEFNVEKPFTYASGLKGPIYVDCRLLMSDVEARKKVLAALAQAVKTLRFDVVAATATGAIPWGAWISDRLDKPMVYVRGEAKAHGKGNTIEGRITPGSRALVVEDIVNRGGSSIKTIESLRNAGASVSECVSIYDYGTEEAHLAFKKADVKLYSLSNFTQAVEAAVARGYLTQEQAIQAWNWAKDPTRWRT